MTTSDPIQTRTNPNILSAAHSLLVVDDDPLTCSRVKAYFEREGYCVRVAANGDEMWDSLRQHPTDVVLLDIGLPGISGIEVARRIRAEVASPPPLIAITGYGQPRDIEASLQAGFHDHLTKPVDVDKLVALLDHLLGSLPAPPASPPRATPGG